MSTNVNSGDDKFGGGDTPGGADRERRKPLRQPGVTPQATGGNDTRSMWQGGNDMSKAASNALSNLSADAPVFVPRGFAKSTPDQPTVGYDVLDRLTTERPAILMKTRHDSQELHVLKDSMFQLISDPASFDEHMKSLVDKFNQTVRDEKSLLQIIYTIYELSVQEVNFRYTGARMCDYLSRHMKVLTESGTFRQHLLKQLHQEFQRKDESIRNLNTIPRLHGFTLFVGELFENFKITVDGKSQRIHVLRGALRDLVHTLLHYSSSNENLKCAINVLKLTGGILEECEQAETNDVRDMDDIFVKLKQLTANDSLHRNIRENLSKLMTLRASGWDRKAGEPTTAQAESTDTSYLFSNEPIFFAADGRQITAEEAGYFYEEYEEDPDYYGNDYEYQRWAQDEGEDGDYILDDEAEADYEQFLRETYHS
ncbi:polyadenylate-binding protein-interacting protein 1-like [Glandiceps talaboti]